MFAAAPDVAKTSINFLGHAWPALTVTCILLFIGAMGKSAQLGLHTWLPDAMEGPTPVSALIHAATMVTAGVFMLARLSPLFEYAPTALAVVVVIGGTTAIFAATIGMAQNDIKRVIAYSTCSQLGYMFFAAGVSAYGAAMFHLMTHAFFKALLFLGAGSVIHAMSGEQDMRKMGGIALSRAVHLCPDVDRQPGAGRHLALRRLLFEGHDPRSGLGGRHRGRHVCLLARRLRGLPDRVLFLAPALHDLPRQARAPTTR